MPAYKVALETRCVWDRYGRCKRLAKYTVYNRWNEPRGTFCLQHANALVREMNQDLRHAVAQEGSTSHA